LLNPNLQLVFTNFPEFVTEEDIVEIFKSKGFNLEAVKIFVSKQTNEAKVRGFLNFNSQEEMMRCLD